MNQSRFLHSVAKKIPDFRIRFPLLSFFAHHFLFLFVAFMLFFAAERAMVFPLLAEEQRSGSSLLLAYLVGFSSDVLASLDVAAVKKILEHIRLLRSFNMK